jgi:hypothetical protein
MKAKGMKRVKFLSFGVLIASLLFILSACSPSRISVEEYNEAEGIVAPTKDPATEVPLDETGPGSEVIEPPQDVETTGEVPEDVPIMDGAYQLQAGLSGKNVVYQIDSSLEDVVVFYVEELPDFGWEMAGPLDNAVGSIGTMLRENAAGDRLVINLQRNEVGGFVRLNITISRTN